MVFPIAIKSASSKTRTLVVSSIIKNSKFFLFSTISLVVPVPSLKELDSLISPALSNKRRARVALYGLSGSAIFAPFGKSFSDFTFLE